MDIFAFQSGAAIVDTRACLLAMNVTKVKQEGRVSRSRVEVREPRHGWRCEPARGNTPLALVLCKKEKYR